MNKIYTMIIILLFYITCCHAQQNEDKIDLLALMSRQKADMVLNHFDSLDEAKILYSLKDEHYYVVFQKGNKFKEYYVHLGSTGRIREIKQLENRIENKDILSKAFDPTIYHSSFKTDMPEATYVSGVPSYFVMKDKDGDRYGEYSLSSLILPSPIEGEIYAYLTRRLSEEISSKSIR